MIYSTVVSGGECVLFCGVQPEKCRISEIELNLWRTIVKLLFTRTPPREAAKASEPPYGPRAEEDSIASDTINDRTESPLSSDTLNEEIQAPLAWASHEIIHLQFNFSSMGPLYREAVENNTPTIAFKVRNGIGQFLFMMFFSEEDQESHDKLYIFLARTKKLLRLKAYGNHSRGDFKVYINSANEAAIREELDIHGGIHRFDLERFLGDLNAAFPKHLSLSKMIETLRDNRDLFKNNLSSTVDDALKIYLIGPKTLPTGQRPREKTLRKLYLHVKADPGIIADFVTELKKKNKTVAWTDDPRKANNNSVRFLNTLNL